VAKINLWHKIGRVHPSSLRINSTKLPLVVVDELDGLGFEVAEGVGLGEGGHPGGNVFVFGHVKALELHWLRVDNHRREVGVNIESRTLKPKSVLVELKLLGLWIKISVRKVGLSLSN